MIHPAPLPFYSPAFYFSIQTLLLGPQGGARGFALLSNDSGSADEIPKPVEGFRSVFLPGAVLLSLDDNHPLFGYALITEFQQSVFVSLGQRGGSDIKSQMDGRGHFVHVLSAGPLGPDGLDVDLR